MLLAQILIRAPGPEPVPALPPVVAQNTRSLVAVHPAWRHRIFLHDEIRDILKERFSPEVSHAFAALKPYAYQADLARYCLLYESGGIYAAETARALRQVYAYIDQLANQGADR